MIDQDYMLRLIDFGAAYYQEEKGQTYTPLTASYSTFRGQSKLYSDYWSIVSTIYYMQYGFYPHSDSENLNMAYQRSLNPDIIKHSNNKKPCPHLFSKKFSDKTTYLYDYVLSKEFVRCSCNDINSNGTEFEEFEKFKIDDEVNFEFINADNKTEIKRGKIKDINPIYRNIYSNEISFKNFNKSTEQDTSDEIFTIETESGERYDVYFHYIFKNTCQECMINFQKINKKFNNLVLDAPKVKDKQSIKNNTSIDKKFNNFVLDASKVKKLINKTLNDFVLDAPNVKDENLIKKNTYINKKSNDLVLDAPRLKMKN